MRAVSIPLLAGAQAVALAGVKVEPQIMLGGQALQLIGAGIRCKAVFKVYAAGLCLVSKASTPEAVLAAPGLCHQNLTAKDRRSPQVRTRTVGAQAPHLP